MPRGAVGFPPLPTVAPGAGPEVVRAAVVPPGPPAVVAENARAGHAGWLREDSDRVTGDRTGQIAGYVSATSVGHGGTLDFHVSVHTSQTFVVEVFRLGDYAGRGARLMTASPSLQGHRRAVPEADGDSGLISCDWPVSWRLTVPPDWVSGIYQAVFTARDGHRSSTPFVVREPGRAARALVVVPFTTYQAYNMWPKDGTRGKNLYRGYGERDEVRTDKRAFKVSFDRPYSGAGTPRWFEMDTAFARWAERQGLDVTYASSVDVHDGTVDLRAYRAVFFPGHDEYWSTPMREQAHRAIARGTHLAFFGANNVYFRIRTEASAAGRPDRTVVCYKNEPDPEGLAVEATARWRDLAQDQGQAEQALLGVQFAGIVLRPAPLVVRESGHWVWAGTGLAEGARLPDLVGVEADRFTASAPSPPGARRTLLAASPYTKTAPGGGRRNVQHTALTEYPNGAMVFAAGTFHWALALDERDHVNEHVRTATANLAFRMMS
ncbi:N,N-dimethylformamidase beta subunit family domain-containing protein [Streptomyces sp. NPDC001941]|uniref:N,N-dimethylformamidase beta subunit family domain-containing protein n=1 Tax=Streptomyces sp. NPDC001941 TaxID=3154659 RepID=UPI00331692B1